MAANLAELYPKRKMEDITNRHKKPRLDQKPYYPPVQERLPSPSSPSSSLSPQRHPLHHKSVSFELSKNEMFEHSPLLTPKEEDYDLDSDRNEPEPPDVRQLDANPDYTALGSTVSLLHSTKERIESDIADLSRLRSKTADASKQDLVDFYVRLICDSAPMPAQHLIVKAPSINWERYHKGLSNVSLNHDCTNNNDNAIFKNLNVFHPSS